MERYSLPLIVAAALLAGPAAGQTDQPQTPADMPWFMQEVTPETAREAAWNDYKAIMMNDETEMPSKYKELTALGVAAQIPCDYCVYAHTAGAKAAGASEEEVKEALAVAAEVRKWSTMLNGSQIDMARFRETIDEASGQVSESAGD